MPSRVAMASAQTPWLVWGWSLRRRLLPLSITMGPSAAVRRLGMDIISVPPATTRSAMPDMMLAAAMLTAVMPEPQNRSSVMPDERVS